MHKTKQLFKLLISKIFEIFKIILHVLSYLQRFEFFKLYLFGIGLSAQNLIY